MAHLRADPVLTRHWKWTLGRPSQKGKLSCDINVVPRGGIEFRSIHLKWRHFSTDDFPVYPSMYPAFSAIHPAPERNAVLWHFKQDFVGTSDARRRDRRRWRSDDIPDRGACRVALPTNESMTSCFCLPLDP
jgi:hypothetical protein